MWSSFCLAMSSIESGGPSTSGLYGGGKNFEDTGSLDDDMPVSMTCDWQGHSHGTDFRRWDSFATSVSTSQLAQRLIL
jgi:hypothetical protein